VPPSDGIDELGLRRHRAGERALIVSEKQFASRISTPGPRAVELQKNGSFHARRTAVHRGRVDSCRAGL